MIVVLDTNIWLQELALNLHAGSALRFFLKRRSARLAIPEVVRFEVEHHLNLRITQAIQNVRQGHRELVALFGSLKEVVLPKEEEIPPGRRSCFCTPRRGVHSRSLFTRECPRVSPQDHHEGTAKRSHARVQGWVIWADCLRLLQEDDVVFATQDKAFFAERTYAKGLAINLKHEAEAYSHRISLVSSIADVLEKIGTDFEIDERWLTSAVLDRVSVNVQSLLGSLGIEIAGNSMLSREFFATENPDLLYFTYVIELPCTDAAGEGRSDMKLTVAGNGTLDPRGPTIVELRPGEETVTYTNSDGTEGRTGNQYMYASAIIGHASIGHEVRHRISGAG